MNDAVILEPQQSTALTVIRAELPTVLAADKDDILGNLQRELAGFEGDASTEKGRKEIASKAYKVSVAKKDLERLATTLKTDAQQIIKGVNAEVNVIKERMDALRDQVRRPLDEYEARIERFEADIKTIESWADVPAEWTSEQIAARIAELRDDPLLARDWQEFEQRAQKASKAAYNALVAAKIAAEDRERAAAEKTARERAAAERERLAELGQALAVLEAIGLVADDTPLRELHVRRAKLAESYTGRDWQELADDAQTVMNRLAAALDSAIAAAEAQEQEAQRAREAEAAARAKQEAEAKAEIERKRLEAEKQEAEARAKRQAEAAEAARIERHRSTIESLDAADRFQTGNPSAAAIQARIDQLSTFAADLEEFNAEAEQTRDATLTRLRAMLVEATERERRQAEALEEARRKQAEADAQRRLKQQQAAERADAEKRAANRAHRARINRDAAAAILKLIIAEQGRDDESASDEGLARRIIEAIARGEVPAVSIQY